MDSKPCSDESTDTQSHSTSKPTSNEAYDQQPGSINSSESREADQRNSQRDEEDQTPSPTAHLDESALRRALRRAQDDIQSLTDRLQLVTEQHHDSEQQLRQWRSQHQELMMQWRKEREHSAQQIHAMEIAHRAQVADLQRQISTHAEIIASLQMNGELGQSETTDQPDSLQCYGSCNPFPISPGDDADPDHALADHEMDFFQSNHPAVNAHSYLRHPGGAHPKPSKYSYPHYLDSNTESESSAPAEMKVVVEKETASVSVECNLIDPYIHHLHHQIARLREELAPKIYQPPNTTSTLPTSAPGMQMNQVVRQGRSEVTRTSAPQTPNTRPSTNQLPRAFRDDDNETTAYQTGSDSEFYNPDANIGFEAESPNNPNRLERKSSMSANQPTRSRLQSADMAHEFHPAAPLPTTEPMSVNGVSAPTRTVTMTAIDIMDVDSLWDIHPEPMQEATRMYMAFLQTLLRVHNGYEFRLEHENMIAAFHSPMDAMRWALDIQVGLVDMNWPSKLLMHPSAAEVFDENGNILFRGLRAKIGMHIDEPECYVDIVTNRMGYRGKLVGITSNLLKSADAGQIIASKEIHAALADHLPELQRCCFRDLGYRLLTNFEQERLRLFEVVPYALRKRMFTCYPVNLKPEDTGGHFRISKTGRGVAISLESIQKSYLDIERQNQMIEDEFNRMMGHALADWNEKTSKKISAEYFVKEMEALQRALRDIMNLKNIVQKMRGQIMVLSREISSVNSRMKTVSWFEAELEKLKKEQADYVAATEEHLKESLLQRLQFARELKNAYQVLQYVETQVSSWENHQNEIPFLKIQAAFSCVYDQKNQIQNFLTSSLSSVDRFHLGIADQHFGALADEREKQEKLDTKAKHVLPTIAASQTGQKKSGLLKDSAQDSPRTKANIFTVPHPPNGNKGQQSSKTPRGLSSKDSLGGNGNSLPSLKVRDLVDALQLEITRAPKKHDTSPGKHPVSAPPTTRS